MIASQNVISNITNSPDKTHSGRVLGELRNLESQVVTTDKNSTVKDSFTPSDTLFNTHYMPRLLKGVQDER